MWQLLAIKVLWIALLLAVLFCLWGLREISLRKFDTKETRWLGYFLMTSGLLAAFVLAACLTVMQEYFSRTSIKTPNEKLTRPALAGSGAAPG